MSGPPPLFSSNGPRVFLVSGDVMGGDRNSVHIVTADGVESWDDLPKAQVATRLAARIADAFS